MELTRNQKLFIIEKRKELPYTSIGKEIGVSRYIVETFLISIGLEPTKEEKAEIRRRVSCSCLKPAHKKLSAKRMSDEDKSFLMANAGEMSSEDMAKEIGFSVNAVNRYLRSQPKEFRRKAKDESGEEKQNTYKKMRDFALKKGYDSLVDALKIPGRYEFIQEFKKSMK